MRGRTVRRYAGEGEQYVGMQEREKCLCGEEDYDSECVSERTSENINIRDYNTKERHERYLLLEPSALRR